MGTLLLNLFNILYSEPGYLIYHLVISLSLILLMIFAASQLSHPRLKIHARQILIGSLILFLIQVILFSASSLNSIQLFNTTLTYPIIERIAGVLTIGWVIWTFIDFRPRWIPALISSFLTFSVVFLGGISLLYLNFQPQLTHLNGTWLDFTWQILSIMVTLAGAVSLLLNRPKNSLVGILILSILAVGHLLQIILPDPVSSLSGAVRLAQTLSLPWLLILTARISEPAVPDKADEVDQRTKIVDTKPMLMDMLLDVSLQETQDERERALIKAVSLSIVADICYLIHFPKADQTILLTAGYDLIREKAMASAKFNYDDLPRISTSLLKNEIHLMGDEDQDTRDVAVLLKLIQFHRLGHLLAYPLSTPTGDVRGGLLFLSPYTGKRWDQATLNLLDEIDENLSEILFGEHPIQKLQMSYEDVQQELTILMSQKSTLIKKLGEKDIQISDMRSEIKRLKAKYQLEKMETVKLMESLNQQVETLTNQITAHEDLKLELEQLQTKNRQLIEEREQLKTALNRAAARIKHLEDQTGQTGPIRLSMKNQIISLDSILANARMNVANQMQRKQIKLAIENPDGRQMIKVDTELLQSILQKLLENAIMASPLNSQIDLELKLTLETGMLILQITDQGEGLTPEEQTALFHAESETIPGIGSIEKIRQAVRSVRLLNGKIWLKSKKHAYTTFRVQLPVRIID